MEKTQYASLCENYSLSAESYFNERLAIVYFYFSILTRITNRLKCSSNAITIYSKSEDKYNDFSNSLSMDESKINWALIPKSRYIFNFGFRIKIHKLPAVNTRHHFMYDEIEINTVTLKQGNELHFKYTDSENSFVVTDYNDDSQMSPVIDAIIADIFQIYTNPEIAFYIGGITIREL